MTILIDPGRREHAHDSENPDTRTPGTAGPKQRRLPFDVLEPAFAVPDVELDY